MNFNRIIKANIGLILLGGLTTNAMEVDIEGHTTNFKPKFTITRLAKVDDIVYATDGVDDLTTPLGLAGTIVYGFKDVSHKQNSIGIAACDTMGEIFNKLRNMPVHFPSTHTQLMMSKVSNLDIYFTIGPVSLAAETKWKLSMETRKPGNLLFFNTSGLAPFGNQIAFTNGKTSRITNTIFPHESTKTSMDIAAVYYLNDDNTNLFFNNGNTLKFGDILTLNFKSIEVNL